MTLLARSMAAVFGLSLAVSPSLSPAFAAAPANPALCSELDGTYGRLRAAVQGPDGSLYVTTSNTTSSSGPVDKILEITPS